MRPRARCLPLSMVAVHACKRRPPRSLCCCCFSPSATFAAPQPHPRPLPPQARQGGQRAAGARRQAGCVGGAQGCGLCARGGRRLAAARARRLCAGAAQHPGAPPVPRVGGGEQVGAEGGKGGRGGEEGKQSSAARAPGKCAQGQRGAQAQGCRLGSLASACSPRLPPPPSHAAACSGRAACRGCLRPARSASCRTPSTWRSRAPPACLPRCGPRRRRSWAAWRWPRRCRRRRRRRCCAASAPRLRRPRRAARAAGPPTCCPARRGSERGWPPRGPTTARCCWVPRRCWWMRGWSRPWRRRPRRWRRAPSLRRRCRWARAGARGRGPQGGA